MSIFSGDSAARLLELLGTELEVFGQMLELTAKQTELIAWDDIDALDESLDRRQELIEKINGLHQESDILMQSYISYLDTAGGKNNGSIDYASAQIRETAAKCAELNEKNMAAAKEKAEGYKERIGKLSLGRKSMGAYIQGVANTPEMFDKRT